MGQGNMSHTATHVSEGLRRQRPYPTLILATTNTKTSMGQGIIESMTTHVGRKNVRIAQEVSSQTTKHIFV